MNEFRQIRLLESIQATNTGILGRSKSHTEYQIEVQCTLLIWSVTRRYSDFRRLKEQLSALHSSALALILKETPFPGKFLSTPSPEQLASRKSLLEAWLRSVCQSTDICRSSLLTTFLTNSLSDLLAPLQTLLNQHNEKLAATLSLARRSQEEADTRKSLSGLFKQQLRCTPLITYVWHSLNGFLISIISYHYFYCYYFYHFHFIIRFSNLGTSTRTLLQLILLCFCRSS